MVHNDGQPCFLNTDTISNVVLKDIAHGKYAHVSMIPELAVSANPRKTILEFNQKISLYWWSLIRPILSNYGTKLRTDYTRLNPFLAL